MINQPMTVKSGGGSAGLHYTKVKSVATQDVRPQFVYQTPDGEYVEVSGKEELPETECIDGSVLVESGCYAKNIITPPSTFHCGVRQTVENDTLVLTGDLIVLPE